MPLNGADSKAGVCQVGADGRETPGRPITSPAGSSMVVVFGRLSIGLQGKKGMVRIFEAERSRSRVGVDGGGEARRRKGFDRSTFCR